MKTLRFLICGLVLMAVLTVYGQTDLEPGRVMLTPSNPSTSQQSLMLSPMTMTYPASGPGYAEANTPDIQALAHGLQNDPVKIFNYVHDHIRHVFYYGSKKGAELTLLEQSGNDMDQCSLLVALLRAAGFSPGYGFGMLEMPYQATDGTQNDLQHWLNLTLTNNNWGTTFSYLNDLLSERGYFLLSDMGDGNHVAFQRSWVTLTISGTNYLLDPAFKISEPTNGINLAPVMDFSSNAVMAACQGTDTGNYASNINEANLRAALTGYTTNLLNYLQSNYPSSSVAQVLGDAGIVPSTNTTLSQVLLFPSYTDGNQYPLVSWGNVPTNFMSTFSMNFAGTNRMWYFPQLGGLGVSLDFTSSGTAQLWLGNSNILQTANTGSGSSITVTLGTTHPYGGWDSNNNVPVDTGWADQSASRPYQRTSANYAIMYAFEPGMKWLNEQEQQLDIYRSEGYANTSPQVVNATLNVMGMEWMVQTTLAEDILCQQLGQLPQSHHRIGRMGQEAGHGYYIDVYIQADGVMPATGSGTTDIQNSHQVFDVSSYFWSALEHGVIQQLQNTNLVAASTIKFLQIANTNKQAIYLANSSNWATIFPKLVNYNPTATNAITTLVNQGDTLLLPQSGDIPVAGSGSWSGYGYVSWQSSGGQEFSGMWIGPFNGGFVSDPSAVINSAFTETSVISQPSYYSVVPVEALAAVTADPVDTADGTFQVESTDLSLGQAEPRGITLSRYYNGTRRFSSAGGMTGGWIHNYCVTANNVAAPQAGLGLTTPAQMAPMLVATCAALNIYNGVQPDPKNWLVTALIAKWAVDQLITNGVSVNLGKDSIQFVQQPNGVFTPPANITETLIQTNSAYQLQMRHGNTFKFNRAGYLTNIVDQYGNGLNVTYNSSNWVSTVKDWKGRTLTFNYGGTPSRLTNVTDGTRSVKYGYSAIFSSQGDLTSFTDAQGDANTFTYDTNHEVTSSIDALNHLVVSNFYDGDGHVNVQLTEGLTNKMWQISWSGFQTISKDPAGNQTTYFYDDMGRLIGTQDALGNLGQIIYDGQNHVIETISALNETNQNFYDGNNNLIETVDALGFTNQYVYDSNDNLNESVDPLGNPSTFGYNTQFSPIGQTNGAGDFVNFAYNSDGTLHTRTDSGGTTTYGYDTLGQLNSVIYPNGLGANTFANSFFGDVTNKVNGRGFATLLQYDARRALTNSFGPTNLNTRIAYDAIGNIASTTDARSNITSQAWSPTRHLLATTLPAMQSGTPVVTNLYDNREWLIGTLDPLQNRTSQANDADGRLISQTDPLQRTVTFGYDADGRKIATTNAASEVVSQTWNAKGKLIALVDGAGHASLRAYDGAGNKIILTNRNNKVWQFHFDGANRLNKTVSPLNRSTTISFNHQGLPAFVTDPMNQVTTNLYDAKGRLTNRADSVASTFYSYDADDNMTTVVENGNTNSWTYDAYDRVSSYTDVNGNLIQYRYDGNGNLTNLIYPGGKNVYYAYDSNNHLTNVTDWSQRKTSIIYDLDGRMTSITRPNGTYRTIGYDPAGEVTNILEQMANSLPIALMRFNWNSNATMQWEFLAPQPHTNAPPSRSMAYDDDNELKTVDSHDVGLDFDGNLLSGPLTNDTFASYSYDSRNRLQNVGGVTNAYDALNNRTRQTYGTNSIVYVVDPNSKLPRVLMRNKNSLITYYIYGPGLLYQVTEAATGTNTLTYHYDYRGSTIALSADNGLVADRMEYSLYATMTYHAGASDSPFLFNGQFGIMSDPNGLLYMRARYYSPFLCRFLNPDPSGFSGGLNFYAYANGNPASYVDPLGLGAVGDDSYFSWAAFGKAAGEGIADGLEDFAVAVAVGVLTDGLGDLAYGEEATAGFVRASGTDAAEETLGSRVTAAYQQAYNDAYQQTAQRFLAGDIDISPGQNVVTVLGQHTDAAARFTTQNWVESEGLSDQVLINQRLYDPSGSGAYRIPDVQIPSENLILDGTIGIKTPDTPQIQDFANWSGGRVQIINPVAPRP
jgi:RHS repeat-associated protein